MRRLSPVERFKLILVLAVLVALGLVASGRQAPAQTSPTPAPSPAQAEQPRVEGCLSCHTGSEPMHNTRDGKLTDEGKDRMSLTCTACHGGNPFPSIDMNSRGTLARGSGPFYEVMRAAHVAPRYPERW